MSEKTVKADTLEQKKSFGAFLKANGAELASYGGLVITFALFLIFTGNLAYNFSSVLQAAATYSIISLGAVFIYSMGFMDVSVGNQIGVYALLLIIISNAIGGVWGVVVGFLVIVALAMLSGAFNGYISVVLGLPSIVTSLFLMFFFGGAQLLLSEAFSQSGGTIKIATSLKPGKVNIFGTDARTAFNIELVLLILVVALVVGYVFNYTKLGKYTRAMGANLTVAKQSGVNTTKWKVIAYMAFGVCVAIGSYIMVARTGSAGKGTGSGYAMDIMICLIMGGMPLSGGMKSKVRCALIGTFTYVLLNNDLLTMGVELQYINFVKAVIFLAIVVMTCRKSTGTLPR